MDAMQKSNLVLSKILNLALEHGISHWDLSFEDLELDESFSTHFWPCIEWLEQERLIRVGGRFRTLGGLANGSATNVALTSQGMAILNQNVQIGGQEVSVSDTVRQASKDTTYFSQVGDLIGSMLGGFTKSIGSG